MATQTQSSRWSWSEIMVERTLQNSRPGGEFIYKLETKPGKFQDVHLDQMKLFEQDILDTQGSSPLIFHKDFETLHLVSTHLMIF